MEIEILTKKDIEDIDDKINLIVKALNIDKSSKLGIIYTTKELSEKLKVSCKTINNWRDKRLIEYCKINGTIIYTELAVVDFLAKHSIKRKPFNY